jgi:hypothetical protein
MYGMAQALSKTGSGCAKYKSNNPINNEISFSKRRVAITAAVFASRNTMLAFVIRGINARRLALQAEGPRFEPVLPQIKRS